MCIPMRLQGKAVERGSGAGRGRTLNLPMPEGMGDAHAWQLLQSFAFPAIVQFDPHVVFLAFGTDGIAGEQCVLSLCMTAYWNGRQICLFKRSCARALVRDVIVSANDSSKAALASG